MRLLVTGGGTGGHVYPLLAVLQLLAADGTLTTNDVLYLGRGGSVEERLAAAWHIPFVGMQVGGLRSLGPFTQAHSALQLVKAAGIAGKEIATFQPNMVLATGGYVSAPVVWAAWRRGISSVIELPDLEPGLAIRATWRLSKQVAVSFDEVLDYFPKGRATVTGYPVRREFYQATRDAGRAHFRLDPLEPVVTVFGGSQGAHALNEAVRTNLADLLRLTQVIHICGKADKSALDAARATPAKQLAAKYHVFEYLDEDMPLALAAADVIVARAGAATLGEFPAVGVPAILVPGRFAAGHQEKNADWLAARGAAVKLPEAALAQTLVTTLAKLLNDTARLAKLRVAMKQLARPDAAKRVGELLVTA